MPFHRCLPPAPRSLHPGVIRGLLTGLLFGLTACDRSPAEPGLDAILDCASSNAVSLSVGESVRRGGSEARTLCIGGAEGAEYVLIPHFLSSSRGSSTPLVLDAEGTAPVVGPPSPSWTPDPEAVGLHLGRDPHGSHALEGIDGPADLRDHEFDRIMRERERRQLASLVGPGGRHDTTPPNVVLTNIPPPLPGTTPSIGTLVTLNAQAREACTDAITRTGEVMAISQGAIILADTARPANGFTQQDFQHFAVAYDTLVTPVVYRNFGQPTDIDGNNRVVLFFTPEVNRLTSVGSERFVGGFFYSRDLFPRTSTPRLQACATSNVGEVLYLMVPDPSGTINSNVREVDFVRRSAIATIAHELQHLVNAARRIHILQLPGSQIFEEIWLNEGMSHMAEELLFFEVSGLAPRSNLGLPEVQAGGSSAVAAINAYHVSNLIRYRRFLEQPEIHSPYDSVDNLEARGAAQQLLRYASDRNAASDEAFFRALVDGPAVGWANLAARVGGEATLRQLIADWSVANYADSRVPGIAQEYRLQSWSHPSLFSGLGIPIFPVRTRRLVPATPVSIQLKAGGSAYVRFSVPGPSVARVTLTSGTGPLPSTLEFTLLRTR
ncbi:hypothetical protein BH23GEM11_BH23GEM11_00070 [soil metagenome]